MRVCDFCRKGICDSDYIEIKMPDSYKYVEEIRDGYGNIILSRPFTKIEVVERDICPECINKIGKLVNLLRYVDFDIKEIENDIFKSATLKGDKR